MNYAGLTDEQAGAQRLVDRGTLWITCDWMDTLEIPGGEVLRDTLHDRDRFQRERDWWREQAV